MATAKKRINITLSDAEKRVLGVLAKRDRVPAATKARELLHQALETEEDEVWDRIASDRDTKEAKYVPHARVWE